MREVVRPRTLTYSGTFHQWFTSGVRRSRTLPTIWVHIWSVAQVSFVLFLGMLTTFCFCPASPRTLAHRALCAAAILSLPDADKYLRCPILFPYEPPLSAASAMSRRSTTLAA